MKVPQLSPLRFKVGPEDSAAHLARLRKEHNIRRVLVTEGGRVLGLVSRSDLVRALVTHQQVPEGELSDDRISGPDGEVRPPARGAAR
jgi:CBS domain-containing protein